MSLMLLPQWSRQQFPSGGYPYTDKRTGHVFDATAGNLDMRVNDVRKHRLANTHIYTNATDFDRDAIRQEIVDFMCNRNPSLCSDVDLSLAPPPTPEAPKLTHSCVKCGAMDATANICLSCGGRAVKNWTCNICGNVFNP